MKINGKDYNISPHAYLREANLREADLLGANLREADLREADLREANLRGANLSGANLREANLRGANLSVAYLSGATLSGATLSGATLSGATLSGADLRGARAILLVAPIGSRRDCLIINVIKIELMFKTGCFYGTEKEFRAPIKMAHCNNDQSKIYAHAIRVAKEFFK